MENHKPSPMPNVKGTLRRGSEPVTITVPSHNAVPVTDIATQSRGIAAQAEMFNMGPGLTNIKHATTGNSAGNVMMTSKMSRRGSGMLSPPSGLATPVLGSPMVCGLQAHS